ncbi:hypothetical protein ACFRH4_48015 [Streptomyces mirabilis]|uniref:hypothetical protein n=1 Tax=Streptomyces mirabilis TaxID=68239 RepID=UPI003699BCB4
MERYLNAPEAVRVLLDTAIDLRRFGHSPTISEPILAEMTSAALDPEVLSVLDDEWFHEALEYSLAPCRGVGGPLSRVRDRPGVASTVAAYRISDYLEQVGRSTRATSFPPADFCSTVLTNIAEVEQIRAIASSLEDTGRIFYAAQLYLRGMELGDYESGHKLAEILEFARDTRGALEITQLQFDNGDPEGPEYLAHYFYVDDQAEKAERLCIDEFNKGNAKPFMKLRETYEYDDNSEKFEVLEARILSHRFPELSYVVFGSKDRELPRDELEKRIAKRLGVSRGEVSAMIDDEFTRMEPRLEIISRAFEEHIEELQAATLRLQELVEDLQSEKEPYRGNRAIHAKIEALQGGGDMEGARKEITKGLNAGIIGIETMGEHLERCDPSHSAESVMRLGVDWDANPIDAWSLANVRDAYRKVLNSRDSSAC